MPEAFRPGVVSVIVPTYNRAHLVTPTLDSVFAQTWRPIELIVVDDGSADETASVLESWTAHHRGEGFEVRLIRQSNQGAQVARNRGLIECTGEYIQFLDSDDRVLEQKLSVQVECLRTTGADYCYAQTEGIDKNGTRLGLEGRPQCPGRPWILERSWHTSSPLYIRRVCSSIGPWNESLRVWQDYEYSARIKAAGFRGIFLDTALCQSCEHDGPSITRQRADVYVPAVFHAVELMLPLAPVTGRRARVERNRLAQYLVNLALTCARQREADLPRLCLAKASFISRGAVKLAMTLAYWACNLMPTRPALELGWGIARLLKRASGATAGS
ncbi:MAG: glycosyltransferase family A protein [Terracidiphilus sp.]